jgi:ribosome biogenesis protein BMS1
MGVLTHLDEFKTAKALRASKKMIKHRFWTEIYQGAKIFHFNGIINNKYLKNECKQLTLYINRVKFRPLQWRNTHPYVIIDRHEDITIPKDLEEEVRLD